MTPNDELKVAGQLPNENATIALGTYFAKTVLPSIIYLVGELGSGKTTFVRGLLAGLGYNGKVKSPTYTLVESYYPLNNITVHHADLYRFTDPQEWEDLGLRDDFRNNTLWLIEWPDKAAKLLPPADVTLQLVTHRQGRYYSFSASTTAGHSCLNRLSTLAGVPF